MMLCGGSPVNFKLQYQKQGQPSYKDDLISFPDVQDLVSNKTPVVLLL